MSKRINVPVPVAQETITQNHESKREIRKIPGGRGGTLTPFTPETSRAAHAARVARKNEVVRAAAQAAVQRGDLVSVHGDEAWIAEVAQAQMQVATTPEAGKASSIAADWLMRHAGMDEPKAGAQVADGAGVVAEAVLRLVAGFAASIPADVVDGLVLDDEV